MNGSDSELTGRRLDSGVALTGVRRSGRLTRLLALVPILVVLAAAIFGARALIHDTSILDPKVTAAPGGPPADRVLDDGRKALRDNNPSGAAATLNEGVKRFPNDQRLRFALAEALLGVGDFAGAYEQYDRGIALGEDRAEYRFAAGMAASQAKLLDQAEAQWLKARELDRSNPQYPLFLAQLQRKLGRNADARTNLVVATKLDPNLAVAWGTLAAIALDENHLDSALQHADKALKLDPGNNLWRVVKAQVLRRDNKPREALDVLNTIPEFERLTDRAAMEQSALCHGLLGQPADAASMYVKALESAPEDADLAFQAAVWLERDRQNERALTYAKRSAMLGDERAKALAERLAHAGD